MNKFVTLKILWKQKHDLFHWWRLSGSLSVAVRATLENSGKYCCFYEEVMK